MRVRRSEVTIDLGALRRNVRALRARLGPAALWAVVKADGYGHGAADVARAALEAGAEALCVATVPEGVALRRSCPDARLLVLGPAGAEEWPDAARARLELTVADGPLPEGIPLHLKVDTGMGRWGVSELRAPARQVVGLMTHLATADCDEDFARTQLDRFLAATSQHRGLTPGCREHQPGRALTRHVANSAAALRLPAARLDAARCGIALYGLSPFGTDPDEDGLEPVLSWRSCLARVLRLEPGESTGYGRRFVAERPTWIGIVPVGYADGFRRDLTGTEVLVEGERRRVIGTVSMDAFAVELAGDLAAGTPVTIIGDGLLAEEHARRARTITYELVSRVESGPLRASRRVVDA